MRTNIVLDDELVEEATRLTGIQSRKELVHEALRALIASRKRISLLTLDGQLKLSPWYDHEALRRENRVQQMKKVRPLRTLRR